MNFEADKYYAVFYQRKFYIGRVLEIMDDKVVKLHFCSRKCLSFIQYICK